MKSTFFVGLDVHLRHTNVCILDQRGNRVKQATVRGPWSEIVTLLQGLTGEIQVCFEASCGYGHLFDQLSRVASRVKVAHPGQLRLIFRSKRKNDRVDAEKLAKLLYLDEVPAVYVPSDQVRAWRQLIEYRSRVVAKRTRAKNSLRALLRSLGIASPRGPSLWTRKGITWLRELKLELMYALRRDLRLDEMELLDQQIARCETQLKRFADTHPAVGLLQTIPGVGPRTAEAVVAYIDDPRRFSRSKQVGCYFGLAPSQDQSGPANRLGHITREGPATVRRLLIEAAWQGIRRSPTIRGFYERIQEEKSDRRKLALVATAHYLARVMHAMLKNGELWHESLAA
ncbi:IS110 family transposase [Blastopirellula marina]|uniref:Uncharacterized protein n=1 Tax=Blastopirellula marina TaxID=124 RepID=A0A2S8GHC2_9BACT|nr:IS110 family transposase [Blastopirellula marina]PQO43837.1 hypothetical protein C5Y93_21870 [Blastopirellula marina]